LPRTGGSLRTIEFARKHKRSWIHISRAGDFSPSVTLQGFVKDHTDIVCLGNREAQEEQGCGQKLGRDLLMLMPAMSVRLKSSWARSLDKLISGFSNHLLP